MGIFDKKTKHEYLAYSVELFEDMPPIMKQTVCASVVQNRNIGKDITANLVNGILWKAKGLYNFALTDEYPWGLPDGTGTTITSTKSSTVKACIVDDIGAPVYMGYVDILSMQDGTYTYKANYWLLDNTGKIKGDEQLWTYNTGAGTYPTLSISGSNQNTPYYPIIPIRTGNSYLADDATDPHYYPVRKALRYLGIDSHDIYDGLKESESENGESAPNDIYVMLGVSLSRNSARTKEYLFRFFKKMFGTSSVTEQDYAYWNENQKGLTTPPQNTLLIRESTYHQEMAWDYITQTIKSGSVGSVGSYKRVYEQNTGSDLSNENYNYFAQGIRLQHQINASQYEEIVVHGLTCQFKVVNKDWVGVTLADAFENPSDPEDGKAFIIPLRRDICNDMGNLRAHDLMYEAIRMYSLDDYTYEVEWYQTGFFKIFTIVLAVALTVLQQYWATGILTAAATAGIVAQTVLASLVFTAITPMLQDILGQELALLVSVLATAFGTSMNFSGSGSLIATSSPSTYSIVSAATQGVSGYKGIQYADELEALSTELEGIQEELDELYAEERQSMYDVSMVMSGVESDPYALLEPSTFVTRALIEPTVPTLITSTTELFVEVATDLDTTKTVINLGHS